MMKKISRRSFLQVCGITAATAALTACGGGKTETAKKDDVHEAVTFMAPYKEIEAFIEQVHSVYPEVNIEVVPYSGHHLFAEYVCGGRPAGRLHLDLLRPPDRSGLRQTAGPFRLRFYG